MVTNYQRGAKLEYKIIAILDRERAQRIVGAIGIEASELMKEAINLVKQAKEAFE